MSDQTDTTRRSFLSAVGGGVAASTLAVRSEGIAIPLDAQLEEVRDATKRYADPRVALEDGFRSMGPYVEGMGWHLINPERTQAAVAEGFDRTRPQLLTYGDTGDGLDGLVLGSAEYAIPLDAGTYTEDDQPDLFDDEDGSESWHVHPTAEHAFTVPVESGHGASGELPESVSDVPPEERFRTTNWIELTPGSKPEPMLERGTVITTNFGREGVTNLRAVVDSTVHPDLLTLHVWVHHENPEGVFVPVNPELPNEPTP